MPLWTWTISRLILFVVRAVEWSAAGWQPGWCMAKGCHDVLSHGKNYTTIGARGKCFSQFFIVLLRFLNDFLISFIA